MCTTGLTWSTSLYGRNASNLYDLSATFWVVRGSPHALTGRRGLQARDGENPSAPPALEALAGVGIVFRCDGASQVGPCPAFQPASRRHVRGFSASSGEQGLVVETLLPGSPLEDVRDKVHQGMQLVGINGNNVRTWLPSLRSRA